MWQWLFGKKKIEAPGEKYRIDLTGEITSMSLLKSAYRIVLKDKKYFNYSHIKKFENYNHLWFKAMQMIRKHEGFCGPDELYARMQKRNNKNWREACDKLIDDRFNKLKAKYEARIRNGV